MVDQSWTVGHDLFQGTCLSDVAYKWLVELDGNSMEHTGKSSLSY